MTALTDRLVQAPSGLFAVHLETEFEEIEESLHNHDRVVARLVEGRRCQTKGELLAHLAEQLRFPSHFGHNWDALYDSLSDLDPRPKDQIVILVDDADALVEDEPNQLATALNLLSDAAGTRDETSPELGLKFVFRVPGGEKSRLLKAARASRLTIEMLSPKAPNPTNA